MLKFPERQTQITKTEWLEQIKSRRIFAFCDAEITTTRGEFKRIRHFINNSVEHLPRDYQKALTNRFTTKFNRDGSLKAFQELESITKPVKKVLDRCVFTDFRLLRDDGMRRQSAELFATNLFNLFQEFSKTANNQDLTYDQKALLGYKFLLEMSKQYKITAKYNPKTATVTQAESGILRLLDSDVWIRQFNTQAKRTNEHLAIALGYVKKKFSPYVSKNALGEHRQQLQANKIYLAMMDVINVETEHVQRLDELAAMGNADPEKRRIELMVRCRGLEELAIKEGKVAVFLTITSPSIYHKAGKKWNGSTPRDTSDYLCKVWARARAKLARKGIEYNGVRVSEPHADATPHWHVLLFVSPDDMAKLNEILEYYFTKEDKQELIDAYKLNQRLVNKTSLKVKPWKTWCAPRFYAEIIDQSKGSATGYIAKYISKNINAKGVENAKDNESRLKMSESCERVAAWASLWGIRQFQFFGSASVSVWRECRRAKGFTCPKMEMVRQAADKGNWQAFTSFMRLERLTLVYDVDATRNIYNEEIKRISGVALLSDSDALSVEITRLESFELKVREEREDKEIYIREKGLKLADRLIKKKGSILFGLKGLKGFKDFELKKRVSVPWSTVTNCTEQSEVPKIQYSISEKDKKKLTKLGMDEQNLSWLLSGRVAYAGIQQFKITNGTLVTH